MYAFARKYINNIIDAYEDTPERQVCPLPFTDVLYYRYGKPGNGTVDTRKRCTPLAFLGCK